MKRTLIFLMIALVALSACMQSSGPAPAAPSAPQAAAPEPATPSSPVVDYSIKPETVQKVESSFKTTTKYALSESYVKLSRGQHHTFGIGFVNRIGEKDNFLVAAKFNRAYDSSTNSIDEATEANVAPWLAHNDFAIIPLGIDEKSVQPIVIEVANFADGTAPPKGSYEFIFEVLYQNGLYSPIDEYSGDLKVVVQVV